MAHKKKPHKKHKEKEHSHSDGKHMAVKQPMASKEHHKGHSRGK